MKPAAQEDCHAQARWTEVLALTPEKTCSNLNILSSYRVTWKVSETLEALVSTITIESEDTQTAFKYWIK